MSKIKIGMIGSKMFEDIVKIKDFMYLIKQKYKDNPNNDPFLSK